MPRKRVDQRPKLLRSPIARGLKAGLSAVDPQGGDEGAGVIRGMAIITRGEALGHYLWIDAEMLQQTANAINATSGGAKSRFTHPGLSGDGMGKFTGRTKNATIDGDVVRGDLHFAKSAHNTPDGNLAGYMLSLAESDPEAFGNSIAFDEDFEAETEFMLAHGAVWEMNDYGDRFLVGFKSPDPENVENYPHARLKELRAVDAVDEPAANPSGLFHRGQEFAADAEALLSYSLRLTSKRPQLSQLDVDPDRAGAFIQRFLDRHNLALTQKEKDMPAPKNLNEGTETKPAEATSETKPTEAAPKVEAEAEATATETPPATPPAQAPAAPPTEAGKGEGAKFLSAFGDKGGVWFAQGKTFAEAQELYVADLKSANEKLSAENGELKDQVKLLKGEGKPVSFQAADPDPARTEAEAKLANGLTPQQARFAASLKMPGDAARN